MMKKKEKVMRICKKNEDGKNGLKVNKVIPAASKTNETHFQARLHPYGVIA